MYHDKTIYIATKHGKEKAIRPVFEGALRCRVNVTENYDTDVFGTFSREIKRKLSAHKTCICKAKTAAEKFNLDYVVASEGSFGPHPTLFFMPSDIEILVFFDATKNIIIEEYLISTETNYSHYDLSEKNNYDHFLQKVDFPSHKLILKDLDNDAVIEKGIDDFNMLNTLISNNQKNNIKVRIETDMRAMCNPTRMSNIRKLAEKLIDRISQNCPNCGYPGFGKIEIRGHLPCEACGFDSTLYKSKVLTCIGCDFEIYKDRDDGIKFASSQYCMLCNP